MIIQQRTAAAPTRSLDILLSSIAKFCIPKTLWQVLRKDVTFQEIEFRCQQIAHVRDIAEREHNIPISINALAMAFECPRSRVQSPSPMPCRRQDSESEIFRNISGIV
jgi:hypothetical protein